MNHSHRQLPSLRRELARSLTAISAVWLVVVFLTMAFGLHHEVDDLMDDALQEAAEVLYGTLVLQGHHLHVQSSEPLPAPPHKENLVWQIVDQQQRVLLRSHEAPQQPLLAGYKDGFSDTEGHWRVYAMRMPARGQILYVAQRGSQRIESRYEAITMVGTGAVLVGLVCAFWLRLRVARALDPLQTLSDQIKRYDPMRPHTELSAPSRQEFVDVHAAIVDLGSRLKRRVDNEQAFAAHAAHALRTPLAGMDAQLAVAMKEVPDAVRPRLERAREAVMRLKRVITSLLALFRSNAELDLQEVHLEDLVNRLPVDGLEVHVHQDGPLRADPNLLAAALANVMDNALRYGASHCWVTSASTDGRQWVTVRDDGPGADADRLATIRASLNGNDDSDRVGLGLKLASLVAKAHNGWLEIADPAPGAHGFSVSLVLWPDTPAAPSDTQAS